MSKQTLTRFAKDSPKYWKDRVKKNTFTRDGKTFETKDYAVKIQYRGSRNTFSLNTGFKDRAAEKACEIYKFLAIRGWEETINTYKDNEEKRVATTLGEFIKEADGKFQGSPKTFRYYTNCARLVASEIANIDGGKSKFSYRDGSNKYWLKKVNSVKLKALTTDAIEAWRGRRLKRTGNPLEREKAERNCSTYIRNARALFSIPVENAEVPYPLPFHGVKLKGSYRKYRSTIDIKPLIIAARSELKDNSPEAYKVFLLAFFCGLRKGEIDFFSWRQIDFKRGHVRIEINAFGGLKSDESEADVELENEVAEELKSFQKPGCGEFVIISHRNIEQGKDLRVYRCRETFEFLICWLRNKGIDTDKPLHTLRKEIGAHLATKHGIYAASRFLRHRDITTTTKHYADLKDRCSSGLGKLLNSSG